MVKKGLAIIVILFVGFSTLAASLGEQEIEYLKAHSQEINLGEAEFPLLQNQIQGKSIFLAGQNQGLEYNKELQKDLLKFFHQEAGVKYLLVEATYASGEFLNQYLQTGEEEYLELVISYWRRSQDEFEFFQWLREYNLEFPEEKQIRIIGFDVQGPPRTLISINYLGDLLMQAHIPLELEYYLLPLVSLAKDFTELRLEPEHPRLAQTEYSAGIPEEMIKDTREITLSILENWEENPGPYQNLLDDPREFFFVLTNIKDAFAMEEKLKEGMEASHTFRSERAFANLLNLLEELEDEKFFGQWEELNVFQKPYRKVEWLGARLDDSNSPFAGKVMSLWYVYHDSFQMQPFSPGEEVQFDSGYIIENLEEIVEISPGEISLFQLNAPDSPFSRAPYFLREQIDGVLTDYFQYIFLIQGSPPTRPFYQP